MRRRSELAARTNTLRVAYRDEQNPQGNYAINWLQIQ